MNTNVKLLLIVAALAGCFASCNKSNDDAPKINTLSRINVVNVSPNIVNFYMNGSRVNNASSYYPGGTLGYLNVIAGAQSYQVKLAGSSNPLFTLNYTLSKDSVYSFYVAGTTVNDVFKTTDVLLTDTGDIAKIRFVNASPDAAGLSLAFEQTVNNVTTATVQFANVPYKTTTNFIKVKSGVRNLAVYQPSQPSFPLRDTVTLARGGSYTFYSYGSVKVLGNQGLAGGLFNN